ncbi:CIS tube protein [Hydrogenimonas sp.]
MNRSKAKFVVLKGEEEGSEVYLQFNPSSYSFEESNEFSEKKLMGLKGVIHQFTGSKTADLSLDLLFDSTSGGGDVRNLLKPLEKLAAIDRELHAPPPCRFIWGSFSYDGIVTGLKREFTYFYQSGIPGRVKVALTLKPYKKVEEMVAQLDLHSSDISKERVLKEGDSIFLLAYREYKQPAEWRRIAKANGIDDPLKIKVGARVLLPPKDKDG